MSVGWTPPSATVSLLFPDVVTRLWELHDEQMDEPLDAQGQIPNGRCRARRTLARVGCRVGLATPLVHGWARYLGDDPIRTVVGDFPNGTLMRCHHRKDQL